MNVTIPVEDLKQITADLAAAGPVVEKQARFESAFAAKGPQLVDLLVRHGMLSGTLKQATLDRISKDPGELVAMFEKFARVLAAPPVSLGGPSSIPSGTEGKDADSTFVARVQSRRR